MIGQSVDIVNVAPAPRSERIAYLEQLREKGNLNIEAFHRHKNGTVFPIEVSTTLIKVGDRELVIGIDRDITERKAAEKIQSQQRETLEYHFKLVEILTSISTRFINLPIDQINVEIDRALKQLGEFEKLDRSYVFLFDHEHATMTNTHEWCAPGVEPQIENLQNLPIGIMPWWMEKINRGEAIHIPLVSQLPPEAQAEREILEPQDIQSLLVVPLISHNRLIGFAGFDAVIQPRTWDADSILLIKMMDDIISNALTRKQTDQVLRSSEEKFSKAFQSSPDSIVISTIEEGRILEVNDGFLHTTGYSRDEVIGRTSLEIELWATLEDRNSLTEELHSSGHVNNLEARFRLKSGELRDGLVSAEIIELENRQKRLLIVVRDITERKQATVQQETAYRIAEATQGVESLQDLYPRIHEHIGRVMYAANFFITLYDESSDTMEFVYSVDEMDERQAGPQPVGDGFTSQVLRTGKPLFIKRAQGLPSHIRTIGSPCEVWLGVPLMAHGKTIGAMVVQHYSNPNAYSERDQRMLEFVSTQVATAIERKQNEEVLRRVELRNRALIENAPDGIVMLDVDGRFIFESPSAARIFGYEQGELYGSPSIALMHPDDRPIAGEIRQMFIENPSAIITRTYRACHKDGSYRWIEATYTNLLNQPGINALVVNFRDITGQKHARELLEKSQASLETAQSIARLGSWELDSQSGAGLSWSKEMYHLFHRNPAQGVPSLEEFMELVDPNDRQSLLDAQQRAIETDELVSMEYRAFPTRHEMRYFRTSMQAVKDEQGQLSHISGTVLDVTESRLMEMEIQERVKELTCLFNVSRLLGNREAITETVCNKIVEYLIPAMQFPLLTVPLLTLDDRRYTVSGFDDNLTHNLHADIQINGEVHGQIQVFYTVDKPFIIPDEQDMLDNVARMLGLWLEQREAEAAVRDAQHELEELNRDLEKRVEERTAELRQREATYRALFENSNDGIFLMSPAGDDIAANEQALKMLGYTLKEYLTLPPNTITVPDQRTDADKRFAAVLRGEHVPLYERTFISKDGKKVDVEINLSPIRDPSGKTIMVQSMVRDITERKKAQEALRESEEQNRLLFEESPDAATLLDGAGKILRANHAYEQLTKVPLDKLVGNNAVNLGLVTVETSDSLGAALVRAISRGEPYASVEYTLSCADGRQTNVESRIFLLKLGGADCILVTTRDITERKKAEEILRESRDKLSAANAALERASRMKDEFLASMSHELRTPLTGILGLSEALQLQTFGALNEKQAKALKNIESSGRHLLDLINDILDLSKIEAGKLDMQFEPCQASDICQASLQLVKGMAHQKKQNVNFSMNPALITVRADARRLKQMLVNLLSNAVKFTAEGGQLGLEVQASEDQKAVFFSVWDKGIGIKPEEMGKLFKPFTQLDSSLARQYAGTGLGLSLVQRMAELHGGSIKVESVPGEGSRFTIILPWSSDATQPVRDIKVHDTGSLKSTLVIEDNELDIEHAIRYLKALDIAHVTQPVIRGALEKAALLRPSAILLDLNMPDGSGMDLLTELKADERTREIPVIIVSVEERRAEAMKRGAIGYLVKPYTQDELRTELSKAAAFARPTTPVMVIEAHDSAPLIMIADDNEMILEMVTDFLEAHGCRVTAARNGFELLERAPEAHPDVMLVDIQMPGMDGMEVMRRLRAHSDPRIASTPIIAVTALAMSGDREKCLQAGANEYMSKPVALVQLIELVKKLLEKRIG